MDNIVNVGLLSDEKKSHREFIYTLLRVGAIERTSPRLGRKWVRQMHVDRIVNETRQISYCFLSFVSYHLFFLQTLVIYLY